MRRRLLRRVTFNDMWIILQNLRFFMPRSLRLQFAFAPASLVLWNFSRRNSPADASRTIHAIAERRRVGGRARPHQIRAASAPPARGSTLSRSAPRARAGRGGFASQSARLTPLVYLSLIFNKLKSQSSPAMYCTVLYPVSPVVSATVIRIGIVNV